MKAKDFFEEKKPNMRELWHLGELQKEMIYILMEEYAALHIADVMAMLPDDNDISEIMMRDKGSSCTNETKGAKWLKTYLKRQLLKGN